ncbi:hypothetical protein DFH11DRAFT_1641126 [Phellopilus nigrolimitatus]|nr:hypothetical protein DFH11DRAFT_1641126 [Phellopilus nigrolimitatus]
MTKPCNRRPRILCLDLLVQLMPALRTEMCRVVVEASFATTKMTSSPRLPGQKFRHMLKICTRQREYGLVYIMYIPCALRAEGVDASRAELGKARKDKWTT